MEEEKKNNRPLEREEMPMPKNPLGEPSRIVTKMDADTVKTLKNKKEE